MPQIKIVEFVPHLGDEYGAWDYEHDGSPITDWDDVSEKELEEIRQICQNEVDYGQHKNKRYYGVIVKNLPEFKEPIDFIKFGRQRVKERADTLKKKEDVQAKRKATLKKNQVEKKRKQLEKLKKELKEA